MIVRELLAVFGIDFDGDGQKKAEAALDGLKGQAQGVGEALHKLGGLLAGSAIFEVFNHAAEAAAHFSGNVRRTNALFGDSAEEVRAWGVTMSEEMGRGEGTMLELANTLAPVAGSFAKNEEEAAKLSTTLAELAVNMGAFFGESDDEALAALRSGLMGMDRPLKKYGITLNEEALQEFARSKGITKSVKSMKESEKALLRYQKILASTTKYQGAAHASLERYGGAKKRFKERVTDLWEAMGAGLLPVFAKVYTAAAVGIEKFLGFAQNTNLLEGAMLGLAIVGAALLLPTLLSLLATVAPFVVAFALFAFILDDVITAFTGGNSVLLTFAEYLDDLEKNGFPGQGAAMEVLITIVNRMRDAVGAVMFAVYSFFEALSTGDWSIFQNAVNTLRESFFNWLNSMGTWGKWISSFLNLLVNQFVALGGVIAAVVESIATGSTAPLKGALEGLKGLGKDTLKDFMGAAGMPEPGSPEAIGSAFRGYAPAAATPSIDTGGLAVKRSQVQVGDTTVTMNIQQEPGESSEDFAQRVAEIVGEQQDKRDEALYLGLVQPVAP